MVLLGLFYVNVSLDVCIAFVFLVSRKSYSLNKIHLKLYFILCGSKFFTKYKFVSKTAFLFYANGLTIVGVR